MTDEEVKEMVAGLAVAQANTGRLLEELAQKGDRRHEETERLLEELAQKGDRRHEETERLLEELAQKGDRRHQETERLLEDLAQKGDRRQAETKRLFEELAQKGDRRQAEADHQLRSLRKEIGGLANKFGGFTEGLALPSMARLLTEKFGMEFVSPDARKRRNGRSIQIDVLAYANTERNAVFVVEVKSRLRDGDIDQILNILEVFFEFFPEHRGKELYAILAAVDAPEALRKQVLKKGIYLAQISDDVFRLQVSEDFEPRSFSEPSS